MRARSHALTEEHVGAFKCVSPYSENDIKKFYKAKETIQEIPVEQLDEKQWRLCIRKPVVHAEDIFLLEGRAA